MSLGTIREFETKNFKVIVDALPEDDLDLSWDDTGEIREGLESGRYIAFVARARVLFRGREVGTDYLGSCIYKSFEDFMDHRECGKQNAEYERKGERGRCGSCFHQMINEACAEARKAMLDLSGTYIRRVV